jgi:hypothetical protein
VPGDTLLVMSEHHPSEPPAQFRYAVGAGLGLLIGGAVGLFLGDDKFLAAAIFGIAVGIVVAYFVKFLSP